MGFDVNDSNDAARLRVVVLEALQNRIREAVSQGEKNGGAQKNGKVGKNLEVGRLLVESRDILDMSYRGFADQLGVSTASIRRWEKEGVPSDKVRLLDALVKRELDNKVASSDSLKKQRGLCYIEDQPVAIRSKEYIRLREKDARIVWVLRSNTTFLSGYPGEFRDFMIEQLLSNREEKMEYRFLYCELKEDAESRKEQQVYLAKALADGSSVSPEYRLSRNKARDSHALFKKACLAVQERINRAERNEKVDIFERARAWPVIEMKDQMTLGVGVLFISMVLMEYYDKAQEDLGREYDVFVEIPAALIDEEHPDRLRMGDVKAWAQLAPHKAQSVEMAWRPVLNKCILKPPFLNSHDDTRKYVVPALE